MLRLRERTRPTPPRQPVGDVFAGSATAPRVVTTNTPAPSRASQDCSTSSTEFVAV
ncbi:hypothetical protein [Mycobacterium kansasii]|uniref:hypothetical protein n=1 Tax=Mycobacterium kansasii TaxID=1768 RepID=UPI0018AD5857